MKKTILYGLLGLCTLGLASCEKDLPMYDSPENRLNFEVSYDGTTKELIPQSYSFIYADDDVMQDTVWIKLTTMGYIYDEDRAFELQQVASDGGADAVPGVHYLPFDDASWKSQYLNVPAGKNEVKVPVIVKKDPSLSSQTVSLWVRVKDNANFMQGYERYSLLKILITNQLVRPSNWDGYMDYYYDAYGPVKHKFMIDVTGLKWNEEFINQLMDENDFGYIMYLSTLCYRALVEENAKRAAEGLDILKEADGTPVTFSFGAYS